MATTRTLDQLVAAARELADQDQPGTGPRHTDDAEAYERANDAIADLWALLIQAEAWELLATRTEVTPASAVGPALPDDFYKLIRLDVRRGNRWCHLERLRDEDETDFDLVSGEPLYYRLEGIYAGGSVLLYPEPSAAYTYRFVYVPEAPTLTLGTDSLTMFNRWWRYVEASLALLLLGKEEDAPAWLVARLAKLEVTIKDSAKATDIAQPRRVKDTRGKLRRRELRTRRDLATWGRS